MKIKEIVDALAVSDTMIWGRRFRRASGKYGKQSAAGIETEWAKLDPLAITSGYDVMDGCAGRPAEGRRCKSVTVKA